MAYHSPRQIKKFAAETLSNMNHIRLLILENTYFSGSLNYLSNELRYVEWNRYPFTYLPKSFQPNQLVELHLSYSSIKQLWKGKKVLEIMYLISFSLRKKNQMIFFQKKLRWLYKGLNMKMVSSKITNFSFSLCKYFSHCEIYSYWNFFTILVLQNKNYKDQFQYEHIL